MENGSERKELVWGVFIMQRFVRRITLKEDVTKEELRAAFDVFKQLIYRDERVSYKDVLSLFHVMINTYKWDHYMYFCLFPPI